MDKKLFTQQLSLPLVSFIVIGMMVGAGVFVYTGIVFDMTGTALPLAYLIAGVPVFLSMLPLAMLGSAMPVSGANYVYPSRMVSASLAFAAVWVYALASFFGQIPLYLLATSKYLGTIIDGIPEIPVALGVLTLFYLVNLLGIKLAAQIQGVLLISLIAALIAFISGSVPEFDPAILRAGSGQESGSLILGAALLTFTYFGANGIIELGSEIKNPGKTIPWAFYIAFPLVMLLYGGVSLSLVGSTSAESILSEADPLVFAARHNLSANAFVFFILGGAILALLTTLNALFLIGTRSLIMIVQDNILPSWMGKMSKKNEVPWVLLTLIYLLSIVGVISGLSLDDFASFASLGGLFIFLPILLAARVFKKRYPELYRKSAFKLSTWQLWLTVGVGIAMVGFFGLVILVDMDSLLKSVLFLVFIGSGFAYYYLRKRYLKKKGTPLTIKPLDYD